MTRRTVELIIRAAIEVAEWISIIIKEHRKGGNKNNDSKGNTTEKRES